MIEILRHGLTADQPCHFGRYAQILFWTKDSTEEIAEQFYAQVMGWA